jgi:hypothetical protein
MGPKQYAQHLTSGSRLPFTAAYFGTIALTMYFAVGVSSAFLICDNAVLFLVIYGGSTEVDGVRRRLHHVRQGLNPC